nr:hypothetical protein CFP56_61521 [Quercus suber]
MKELFEMMQGMQRNQDNLAQAIQRIEESNKARDKENPRRERPTLEKGQNEKVADNSEKTSLKMQKWRATNPTAKGMTFPINNQQCKALNINFKTKNPSRAEHMGAAGIDSFWRNNNCPLRS